MKAMPIKLDLGEEFEEGEFKRRRTYQSESNRDSKLNLDYLEAKRIIETSYQMLETTRDNNSVRLSKSFKHRPSRYSSCRFSVI
jgi:hypothetical protein